LSKSGKENGARERRNNSRGPVRIERGGAPEVGRVVVAAQGVMLEKEESGRDTWECVLPRNSMNTEGGPGGLDKKNIGRVFYRRIKERNTALNRWEGETKKVPTKAVFHWMKRKKLNTGSQKEEKRTKKKNNDLREYRYSYRKLRGARGGQ